MDETQAQAVEVRPLQQAEAGCGCAPEADGSYDPERMCARHWLAVDRRWDDFAVLVAGKEAEVRLAGRADASAALAELLAQVRALGKVSEARRTRSEKRRRVLDAEVEAARAAEGGAIWAGAVSWLRSVYFAARPARVDHVLEALVDQAWPEGYGPALVFPARNGLRDVGYDEKAFGIGSLTTVVPALLEDAVRP